MSKEEKKPVDNRTAVQKIADLENAVMSLYHLSDNLTRDMMTLKEAIKLLDNKVNSVVQAVNGGEPLTDAVLSRIMTANNAKELTVKVNDMISQGFFEKEEQVSENSFVVGSEENESGETVNPRLQFVLKAMKPELQSKLVGRLPGEVVHFEEGKLRFKVLESYLIKDPTAAAAPTDLKTVSPVEALPEQTAPAVQPELTPATNN